MISEAPREKGRGGFLLAEVLVATALFGIIAALAFAPSVVIVRRLEEVRREDAAEQGIRYSLREIPQALRLSPRSFPGGPAVVVIHGDVVGGRADDRFSFWSDYGRSPGVRAYAVVRPRPGLEAEPGLYRWILPLASPTGVDWENLDPERGKLIMAGIDSLRVSVWTAGAGKWTDEYAGPRPGGVRLLLGADKEVVSHEDWLPQE